MRYSSRGAILAYAAPSLPVLLANGVAAAAKPDSAQSTAAGA
jgi:hypothetical protein